MTGPEFSCLGRERTLFEKAEGTAVEKFRLLLGPVGGGRNPAGPRGGDLGATDRIGERSRGVDLAEPRSLYDNDKVAGERSRVGGERVLGAACETCGIRSG